MMAAATTIAAIDPAVFAALITGLFGAGGIGAFVTWRKTSAESESISAATLRGVIDELRKEIERIQSERAADIKHLREENAKLRERIAVLEAQMITEQARPH